MTLILQLGTPDYVGIATLMATVVIPSVAAGIAGVLHFVGKTNATAAANTVAIAVLSEKLNQSASRAQIAVVEAKIAEAASRSQVAVIESKMDLIIFKLGVESRPS